MHGVQVLAHRPFECFDYMVYRELCTVHPISEPYMLQGDQALIICQHNGSFFMYDLLVALGFEIAIKIE